MKVVKCITPAGSVIVVAPSARSINGSKDTFRAEVKNEHGGQVLRCAMSRNAAYALAQALTAALGNLQGECTTEIEQ